MAAIARIFDLLDLFREEFRDKQDLFCGMEGRRWKSYSSEDYLRFSHGIGAGLIALGAGKGTRVATVMVNSPQWNFFDMGIMMAGAVQVPIYPTISPESYRYILSDAAIEVLIVSNSEIYHRIREILPDVPGLRTVFSIKKIKGVRHWTEILELGKDRKFQERLQTAMDEVSPEDLATIIYTSGTTGRPKGVMLNHRNFITNFMECSKIYRFKTSDRALSFLPLCHVYERMLNYYFQYYGMTIYYVETLEKVGECMREVKPNTFAAVPRVLEKIYNRLILRGRNFRGLRKQIFFWAIRLGHQFELEHANGPWYDLRLFLARRLVFDRWKKALGGNLSLIVSGSASLHPRLARIFWAAGIPVMEGYGLTETSPVVAVSRFEKGGMKFGTVGPLLPGVEVKFADDGEILVKGPNVMMGYYNRPDRMAEVFDEEGWFHTGDIGLLEDGRYLRITDRKKEMFKTSTGKYIAPQVIEQRLKESPFIEHAMVMGENRKYTAALIVPNFEHIAGWCRIKGINIVPFEKLLRHPRVVRRVRKEVQKLNETLGQTEKIKKFRLIPKEWTVETGELSPTMKLRRKFILEKYEQLIEETYRSSEYDYRVDGI